MSQDEITAAEREFLAVRKAEQFDACPICGSIDSKGKQHAMRQVSLSRWVCTNSLCEFRQTNHTRFTTDRPAPNRRQVRLLALKYRVVRDLRLKYYRQGHMRGGSLIC